jgi:hypothetical protein
MSRIAQATASEQRGSWVECTAASTTASCEPSDEAVPGVLTGIHPINDERAFDLDRRSATKVRQTRPEPNNHLPRRTVACTMTSWCGKAPANVLVKYTGANHDLDMVL